MAGEAGAPPKDARGGAKSAVKQRSGSAMRSTLLLAVLLTAVGVGGGGALKLLEHAMRVPTADDTAQLVCTAYTHQNYDQLIQVIDPAPVAPTNTGAFDANTLRGQLNSLDVSQGDVSGCTYKQLDFTNIAAGSPTLQYSFVLHRTGTSRSFDLIMTLVHESDDTWKVSRASNFTGATG